MRKNQHVIYISFLLAVLWISGFAGGTHAKAVISSKAIDQVIEEQMELGRIPGMSVVVVKKDEVVYQKGFGYADQKKMKKVTASTFFEIGSTSKAFTALAIVELEKQGKLHLKEPVSSYIPGFFPTYHGKSQRLTVEQLMHHTSGIPFQSIALIQPDHAKDALKKTVHQLKSIELHHKPGSSFEYATINYDVLGLIIENVTGTSYEAYMKGLFKTHHLNQTEAGLKRMKSGVVSEGFKLHFLAPHAYEAPEYRGNTPAGYIVMNNQDVGTWLQYQLTDSTWSRFVKNPDQLTVKVPEEGEHVYYNAGWYIEKTHGQVESLFHAGSNPNYSSFFLIQPKEDVAIGVLANMNSSYTEKTARLIAKTMTGTNEEAESSMDPFQLIDQLSVAATCLFILLQIVSVVRFIKWRKRVRNGVLVRRHISLGVWLKSIGWVLLLIGILLLPMILSQLAFKGLPWKMTFVWGPFSLIELAISYYLFFIWFCTIGFIKGFMVTSTAGKRGQEDDRQTDFRHSSL
ncbi:beta-lactamase family protein [Bacillus sp. JNUCC-24]|uniref:serine hydrolase domain-containing protein n=1 Tax=Bacillus sp. JNUCC-24 TaxID=2842458 RepID=UPI001C0D5BB2|nr:serine hydrolase domain-containing protein [Bacillus sp. JNUCC-24]QWS51182.1 beta-lactamase family protein [Bacillus sp. JNUCC-24]